MVDILHRIGIKASVAEVYTALTTQSGLAAWWTSATQCEAVTKEGGAITFRSGRCIC